MYIELIMSKEIREYIPVYKCTCIYIYTHTYNWNTKFNHTPLWDTNTFLRFLLDQAYAISAWGRETLNRTSWGVARKRDRDWEKHRQRETNTGLRMIDKMQERQQWSNMPVYSADCSNMKESSYLLGVVNDSRKQCRAKTNMVL